MKLYISADMEGSTGIVSPCQVDCKAPEYTFGCSMQLHDVLSAVNAALEWGVESVTVNDSHDRMINLDISKFPRGVQVISGSPKILGMVDGVQDSNVAFFMGYHAMAGTEKAILDHTYEPRTIFDMKLNGIKMGETALNALFCGKLGVPVGMVTGDTALCLEASSILGSELVTCELKEGVGRIAAKTLPPSETSLLIASSVKEALDRAAAGKLPVFDVEPPYTIEVTFHTAAQTDAAALLPGSERISGRGLVFNTEDIFEIRRWFCSAMDVAEIVPF